MMTNIGLTRRRLGLFAKCQRTSISLKELGYGKQVMTNCLKKIGVQKYKQMMLGWYIYSDFYKMNESIKLFEINLLSLELITLTLSNQAF